VKLADVDVEDVDRVEDQPGQQACPVSVKEPGQATSDPVVVE